MRGRPSADKLPFFWVTDFPRHAVAIPDFSEHSGQEYFMCDLLGWGGPGQTVIHGVAKSSPRCLVAQVVYPELSGFTL